MKPDETICPLTGKPCLMPKHFSITELEGGKVVKTLKLCNYCGPKYLQKQEELKKTKKPENSLQGITDFLNGIVKAITQNATMPTNLPNKEPCPRCGTSIEDILNSTKLGCPYCYDHYSNELRAVLSHSHDGAVKHVGKIPKNWKPLEESLEQLEVKMQKAIDKEDYEEAARLRDKIKGIKEKS